MIAARPLSPATHEWWGYQRPAEFDVVGVTVEVPMRDGITLSCSLRRPARDGVPVEGRFPGLVVEFTPYVVLADFYAGEADFFVARGYTALVGTMRGVGESGGRWEHGSFRQGGRDAHDLVEWLAAQEFCDGRIGMFGESFGGQTSYGAAIEQPAHLLAIAPMQSPGSLYHDVIFPGGVKTTERGEIDSWPDIAAMTSGGSIDADAEFAANRAHPTFDDYWRDRSFVDVLDRVTVPVLAVGGWNDHFFRSGTLANIEAIPDPDVGDLRVVGALLPGRAQPRSRRGRRARGASATRCWPTIRSCRPACCSPGSTTGWPADPMRRSRTRRRSSRSKGRSAWAPDGRNSTDGIHRARPVRDGSWRPTVRSAPMRPPSDRWRSASRARGRSSRSTPSRSRPNRWPPTTCWSATPA